MELPSTYPWLVFSDGNEDDKSGYICTLASSRACRATNLPNLTNKTVWNCCHGWLVLSDKATSTQFSLWNPVTSELIDMPSLEFKTDQDINAAILFPPADYNSNRDFPRNSIVFLFDWGTRSFIYCRIGDHKDWTYVSYAKEIDATANNQDDFKDSLFNPIVFKGSLYAETFGACKKMVSICHIDDPTRIDITEYCDQPECSGIATYDYCYLVESFSELFRIDIWAGGIRYNEVIDVEVFKLDQVKLTWYKVSNDAEVDKVSFFVVNKYCALSCQANIQGNMNGGLIYLSAVVEEEIKELQQYHSTDLNHYVFNIQEKNLSILLPNIRWKIPVSCGQFIWTMPDLRLISAQACEELERGEQISSDGREMEEQDGNEDDVLINKSSEELEDGPFSYLPHDILRLVSRYFDPIDYMNFRIISKNCEAAAPSIQWRKSAVSSDRLNSPPLSPLLMFITGNAYIHNFIHPKFDSKYLMEVPESIVNAKIRYSSKGWLLMTAYDETEIFFYNPFTKEIIELPKPRLPIVLAPAACFSSSPLSSDCTILTVGNGCYTMGFHFFRIGQGGWTSVNKDHEFSIFSTNSNNPVLHNGVYYVLSQQGLLGAFEMQGQHLHEDCTWDILEDPKKPCDSFDQNFLLECDGRLLSVFVGHLGKWVQVFALNDDTMTWEKVENLENYTLYLNRWSSFSTLATSKEMGNKIFFSRFNNNGVVYYSLETGSYGSFVSNDYGFELYNNSKEPLFSTWIEPTWPPVGLNQRGPS